MKHPEIKLLPEKPHVSLGKFKQYPGAIACDCYIEKVEELGIEVPWGWSLLGGHNIDHHAPVPRMARHVSSANLALEWIDKGPGLPTGPILLTHTDCDSILTAGIVSGRLEPDERYGVAAIAADHTGIENPIADLLRAIHEKRKVKYSLKMLARLEAGLRLPDKARKALADRQRKREVAAEAVINNQVGWVGPIAWAEFNESIDGEFFPPLLPAAGVIVVGSPMRSAPGRWAIKVRLGWAMPEGWVLDPAELQEIDEAYGGRWDAGSTKRGGGSTMRPEKWARALASRLGQRAEGAEHTE